MSEKSLNWGLLQSNLGKKWVFQKTESEHLIQFFRPRIALNCPGDGWRNVDEVSKKCRLSKLDRPSNHHVKAPFLAAENWERPFFLKALSRLKKGPKVDKMQRIKSKKCRPSKLDRPSNHHATRPFWLRRSALKIFWSAGKTFSDMFKIPLFPGVWLAQSSI